MSAEKTRKLYFLWCSRIWNGCNYEWDGSSWRFMPYGGTFHMFTDYMRNGMRMAALMKQRVDLCYNS